MGRAQPGACLETPKATWAPRPGVREADGCRVGTAQGTWGWASGRPWNTHRSACPEREGDGSPPEAPQMLGSDADVEPLLGSNLTDLRVPSGSEPRPGPASGPPVEAEDDL